MRKFPAGNDLIRQLAELFLASFSFVSLLYSKFTLSMEIPAMGTFSDIEIQRSMVL